MTYDEIESRVRYDSSTGKFYRKTSGGRFKEGEETGWINTQGYRCLSFLGREFLAHRVAWFLTHKVWPKEIDHINGDRSDNRIINLREVTSAQNKWNTGVKNTNKTGFRNVYKHLDKYRSRFMYNGHMIEGGVFDTPEEAFLAISKLRNDLLSSFIRKEH